MVFLMETRLKKDKVLTVKMKSGFDFCQVVDCNSFGRKRVGGQILFWKEIIQVDILYFSTNNISGLIRGENGIQDFYYNRIYDFPEEANKRLT